MSESHTTRRLKAIPCDTWAYARERSIGMNCEVKLRVTIN